MEKAAAGGNREAWGKRLGKRLCTRLARVRNQTDHSGLPEVPAGGPISGEGRVFGGGDARTHVVAAGTTRGGRDVEDVVARRGAPRLAASPTPGAWTPPRRRRGADVRRRRRRPAAEARLRVRVQRVGSSEGSNDGIQSTRAARSVAAGPARARRGLAGDGAGAARVDAFFSARRSRGPAASRGHPAAVAGQGLPGEESDLELHLKPLPRRAERARAAALRPRARPSPRDGEDAKWRRRPPRRSSVAPPECPRSRSL